MSTIRDLVYLHGFVGAVCVGDCVALHVAAAAVHQLLLLLDAQGELNLN